MEPVVESIILHPAVLIAAGFETITSRQVRFLNAHRLHFHSKLHDLDQTFVASISDFELGGIMNPYGILFDAKEAYAEYGAHLINFPYLTRRQILRTLYLVDLDKIWSEMMMELFTDLSDFCIAHKRSRAYLTPSTTVIHELYNYPIYQKISALHLCGLGSRLIDSFAYVFEHFKKYEDESCVAVF